MAEILTDEERTEEYNLQDKIDVIYMKNQLLAGPMDEMKKLTESYDDFGTFIDILNITLDAEPAFFLLDTKLLDKAEDLMSEKRFEYPVPINNQIINEIIGQINALRTLPEDIKTRQLMAYIEWNCEVRQLGQLSSIEFLQALAYDAEVIDGIVEKDLSDITNPLYFFSTINYLTVFMPELIEKHPQAKDLVMDKLDQHINKKGFWNWAERSFAKEAKSNLQKVKKIEE